MEIQSVDIETIFADPKNARKHNEKNLKAIKGSLEKFGQQKPIVVNEARMIIAGNGTFEAAKQLGWTQINVVFSKLNKRDEKAFALADNRTAEIAEWDDGFLDEALKELCAFEFDLGSIGFDESFVKGHTRSTANPDDDKVPDVPKNVHKVKRGQVWQLGAHRLMCGDSTSEADVAKLMDGKKADMVFTDPPYNINFKPPRGTHEAIKNDNMSSEKFMSFLESVCENLKKFSKKDTYAFIWSGWSTIDQFAPVLRKFYEIKAMPIWVKNNFGIGYYSRPKYEPFFLCLNGEPKKPDQAPADVWEYAKVHDTIHSCEKPVGLIEDIFSTYTNSGFVLDLFGGSGSTLIACEKTNHANYSMELDEHYCSVIIERWQQFTGKTASVI